jgi:hypothetical protein
MEKHRCRTGLDHDPVMVFPQGVFSTPAAAVLKHNGFLAAVNTEVSPIDQTTGTDIGSVWSTAILKYADFPIYTRRYTSHGLHNFAFDLLLGKPCLLVTHHGDFRNGASEVVGFVDRLNALPVRLTWRTLADVLRRAYQQQRLADGTFRIRMYGNEIALENPDSTSRHILIEKTEHAPENVDRIEADGAGIRFLADQGVLRFNLRLNAGEIARIRVFYKDSYGDPNPARPLSRQLKLAARRYLSEFRDETQARAPWIYSFAHSMRKPSR